MCSIDRFVELNGLRREVMASYSEKGRPSIDPELLIGIVGYCFGICWDGDCARFPQIYPDASRYAHIHSPHRFEKIE